MKNFKRLITLVSAATILLSGCSGASTAATASAAASTAAADDGILIGLAMHNQTETWAVQYAKSFQEAATADGVKVSVTDANSTPANQVSQIEDLIAQGIDVLVVLPADYTALGNVLKEAKDAGVKVVNADSKVDAADQELVDCFVTADAYKGGYTAGEYLADVLPENATIGTLNYSQLSVIADRFVGMADAFAAKGRTDIKVIEKDCTDLSAIATYTEDMLISNPEIVGFLCLNDNTALTCYGTCKQMNMPDEIVIGFDGSPAGKQSISAGEMTGTMVYSPVDLAKSSEKAAVALAKGETVEKETTVDMYMINKDNLSQYSLDEWN